MTAGAAPKPKRVDPKIVRLENDAAWSEAITNFLLDGAVKDLSVLLTSSRPIPQFARRFLSEVLEGAIELPDRRGKNNRALTPRERAEAISQLWALWSRTLCVLAHSDQIADELGKEVIEIKRYLEQVRREGIERIAARYGVSPHTVRQLHDARETAGWVTHFGVGSLDQARALMKYPDLFFGLTE